MVNMWRLPQSSYNEKYFKQGETFDKVLKEQNFEKLIISMLNLFCNNRQVNAGAKLLMSLLKSWLFAEWLLGLIDQKSRSWFP